VTTKKETTLLEYYQEHELNPVPINVEDHLGWKDHVIKRRNLYEKHLMLPTAGFRDRAVIEFGCNSGENALYLAALGARLTLVEPNGQVLPRLRDLFERFGLASRIEALVNTDIAGFETARQYDVVLAEGFLSALAERDQAVLKLGSLVKPGGLGVISFDDRYGSLMELLRQMVFRRARQLAGVEDQHGEQSLELARDLFGEDFGRLNASRPFEAWWEDVLVSPFVSWKGLWCYHEVLALLEQADCEFYSSSPRWVSVDNFTWYKNVTERRHRHERILEQWNRYFAYFLTGQEIGEGTIGPAPAEVVESVDELVKTISGFVFSDDVLVDELNYPDPLDEYLDRCQDASLTAVNQDMKALFEAVQGDDLEKVSADYQQAKFLRNLWGTHGHYISFVKA